VKQAIKPDAARREAVEQDDGEVRQVLVVEELREPSSSTGDQKSVMFSPFAARRSLLDEQEVEGVVVQARDRRSSGSSATAVNSIDTSTGTQARRRSWRPFNRPEGLVSFPWNMS